MAQWLIVLMTVLMTVSCVQRRAPEAPVAKIEPKENSLHGVSWVDNYYWLRERDSKEVLDYLKAENLYTSEVMAKTEKMRDKLYEELKSRIKETDLTVPYKYKDYYYYDRTEEGKQYSINCRKKRSLEEVEEIILDENELANGHGYMAVGVFEVSPNQEYLAYSVDTNGSENYTIHIKNLKTGKLLQDRIPSTYESLEWGNDNKTIFYATFDETHRPYRLYRHQIGKDYTEDELLYEESNEQFWLTLSKTKSEQYLLLGLGSSTTSEYHYLDADKPDGSFKMIHPRQHLLEYEVFHNGKDFYIVTNDNAVNFKVVKAPTSNPSKKNWVDFIPAVDSVKIDGLEMFKDHMAVYCRINGLKQIKVLGMKNEVSYFIDFPEEVYTYSTSGNYDYDTDNLRFTYMSMISPKAVYDYNMKDKTRELRKEYEVLGGYDKNNYETHRLFATASDGTKIPISIVYKKGLKKDGNNPFYLYGYGAYGISMEPYFSSNRFSLLNRGFVFAIAHVRGGGEMGRPWYDDGKMLKKKNSFTDFIACAEYLIAEKYTSPEKLVMSGASAGGLLVGAVVNIRPDLFKAVVADVPFVDVINTMLDPTIPLTVNEYEEWGNPNDKEYFDHMYSYSPYDNVKAQNYPNMLLTAGLNDPRVQYWEPAKWTAKLRTLKTDDNLLLLKTNMGAGHGGASGRYDYLKEIAFEYVFLFDVFGINF